MTDKISPINQYLVEIPSAGQRPEPIWLMPPMPNDQVLISTRMDDSTGGKSSLKSRIGSLFNSLASSISRFINKIFGKKEESGIVEYFDGDSQKASQYIAEAMRAQSPEDLDRIAMNYAASTQENKELVAELSKVSLPPSREEAIRALSTGQDPSMQNVEEIAAKSIERSQKNSIRF